MSLPSLLKDWSTHAHTDFLRPFRLRDTWRESPTSALEIDSVFPNQHKVLYMFEKGKRKAWWLCWSETSIVSLRTTRHPPPNNLKFQDIHIHGHSCLKHACITHMLTLQSGVYTPNPTSIVAMWGFCEMGSTQRMYCPCCFERGDGKRERRSRWLDVQSIKNTSPLARCLRGTKLLHHERHVVFSSPKTKSLTVILEPGFLFSSALYKERHATITCLPCKMVLPSNFCVLSSLFQNNQPTKTMAAAGEISLWYFRKPPTTTCDVVCASTCADHNLYCCALLLFLNVLPDWLCSISKG